MTRTLYITPTEPRSGKSAIALGLMEILLRNISKVGFFRPIINEDSPSSFDHDIHLIRTYYKLDVPYESTYAYTFRAAKELINLGHHDVLLEGILSKFKELENQCDFVLCEGTDFEGVTSAFEFDINSDIANNLGSPLLVITNGRHKSVEEVISSTRMAVESFEDKGVKILGVIVNRVQMDQSEEIVERLKQDFKTLDILINTIPDIPTLGKPTIREIVEALDAEVLYGADKLERHAYHYTIAAMQLRNFLDHIENGSLVVTPGDRADIILGSLIAGVSTTYPNIAGILLTGGLKPEDSVLRLIDGWSKVPIPILFSSKDTYTTTEQLTSIHAEINPNDHRKIATALGVFESHVNIDELRQRLETTHSTVVTPKMFEYGLIQRAKTNRQHIVLPEGGEDRILKAAEILTRRNVVKITLLGNVDEINEKIAKLGLQLDGVEIIQPNQSPDFEDYAQTYAELRKHKGITLEHAHDIMADVTYFGTMMVYKGHADGMVSGAVHTTQQTIRPAFEFIRTKPGASLVSSVFFMCLKDRTLVYGDCAVNPNPNAEQLAEIGMRSAETAQVFGIEPRVAMLSYSTGSSGKGAEVEKVREATRIAQEQASNLKLEGPIQYDAAVDPDVAKTKMPDSKVAGQATVFIFPDLNTGNNTYKAVQRSAQAVAIGPVLQGLNKPVNDLSRGCLVPDIVNTVVITAIQAQAEKGGA